MIKKVKYVQNIILGLIILSLVNCKNDNQTLGKANSLISRIHSSNDEIDYYNYLGKKTLKEHLDIFESINWENEYWIQDSLNEFNVPDLEIMNEEESRYLSISVCPNTINTYQYMIGLGTHDIIIKENDTIVKRTVKLYGTKDNNINIPKKLIKHFYNGNYEKIKKEIDSMDYFDEIEDVYKNNMK